MSDQTNPQLHRTLGAIVKHAGQLREVPKAELRSGDCLLVATANSTYSIQVLEDGFYSVSGGWFDREGLSPFRTTITGCSWGGSAFKLSVVASLRSASGVWQPGGNQPYPKNVCHAVWERA